MLGARNYTDAVDMWSLGCVIAEIFTGQVLFPGDKEEREIELIYEKCGIPTEENWPGLNELKLYKELAPKKEHKRIIKEYLKRTNSR